MRRPLLLFLVSVVCSLPSCRSLDRLFRISPLTGVAAVDQERVNVWPLFYQLGDQTAVLWPIYDQDQKGFALRPLITHDGDQWELLPPLAWWDTETGNWVFLPAYKFGDAYGLFPLFGIGPLSYLGPLWWTRDDAEQLVGGLFPLVDFTADFSHVGPLWWSRTDGELSSYGLFPLVDFGAINNIGPVIWSYGEDGEIDFFSGFPLFGYGRSRSGDQVLITPLGGAGWDADGESSFVNVLGPLYHYDREGEQVSHHIAWPLFSYYQSPRGSEWLLWPLLGRKVATDASGRRRVDEVSALSYLFEIRGVEQTEAMRLAPLFSYVGPQAGNERLLDYLTLFGMHEYQGGMRLHIGTPLVFNYRSHAKGYGWSGPLGILDYETSGQDSEFSLLYYLYRQQTTGTETRRDFFPFCSWDSGRQRAGFSFLWRLFSWQRRGDKVGGHLLFIPWGDL